jgi:ribulose-phosphate 3-epimerase
VNTPVGRPGASIAFNAGLVGRVRRTTGVDLAGSLYAVPAPDRLPAAGLLVRQRLWIHADVFADTPLGVGLDLITGLAEAGTHPIDVHLLTAGALDALDVVCRPGIARVTLPYEGSEDLERLAARVRTAGPRPWLALAPNTALDDCREVMPYVDGVLVMLIEPGTRGQADLTQLGKVREVAARHQPVGVDGGVNESNLDDILGAGATYVVIGRRLFTDPGADSEQALQPRAGEER